MTGTLNKGNAERKASFGVVMAVYLLGLVVGGLYVGMVAPVRTVIQAEFGIGNGEGIWIITIYALFYASFIPVIGKLADRRGRKPVFLACMTVFCIGAAICGVSEWIHTDSKDSGNMIGYVVLLAGRVLQAIGACGIIPVANAEIGTSAPPEKRGFALGITAAASGLSNVLGAGVGSAIIGIVGQSNWPVLFFACIPFGILAIVGGAITLPEGQRRETGKVDVVGAVSMIAFVFLLLLGIQFASSAARLDSAQTSGGDIATAADGADMQSYPDSLGIMPMLTVFAGSLIALIVFVIAERRADDPFLPSRYFKSRKIIITLGVSFCVGGMINSMTLVSEFAEVALDMPLGSGGIYMVVIGIFSLAGPPMGGKLIDKHGPKPVLMAGLLAAALGYLLLSLIGAPFPSVPTIVLGLAIMGMGLGFCMGTPVNYMILQNVPESESNSAISAVTLVRQVGLSIAPAVYVAFITPDIGSAGYSPMFLVAVAFTMAAFAMMLVYKDGKR